MANLIRLLCCLCTTLLSGIANSATLQDVLDQAWAADYELHQAQRQLEAGQQQRIQGRAALLPSVGVQYSHLDNDRELKALGTDETFDTETTTVRLTQPLFRPGAWYTRQSAVAATRLAEAEFAGARQGFLLRVAEQYFGVLRAWENLSAARAEERAIRRQLEQTRERFDVGLIPITDVHEAEAIYDTSQVGVIMTEAAFQIARDQLEALTGTSWQSLSGLADEMPLEAPEPADGDAWVSLAQQYNPQLLAADAARDISRHNSRQQLANQLPVVDLVAQHQNHNTGATGSMSARSNSYGVEISMPLFQGGALQSRRKQSALQAEASQDSYRQAWRDVGQQTRAAWRTLQADLRRIHARQQAIRSAQSALRATESGYEVGTRNIVDVLNAQRGLFAAQRDYANSRHDYILNSLSLKALAGQLATEDLLQIDQWLSPENAVSLVSTD